MFNWKRIKDTIDFKIKFLITLGTLVTMLLGAAVWYNESELPRWAWKSEVKQVQTNSLQTQMDFYLRSKRSDERVLFDLDNEIDKLKQQNKQVPETALQQRMRIQEDIDHSKQRLDDAKAKMRQQQ